KDSFLSEKLCTAADAVHLSERRTGIEADDLRSVPRKFKHWAVGRRGEQIVAIEIHECGVDVELPGELALSRATRVIAPRSLALVLNLADKDVPAKGTLAKKHRIDSNLLRHPIAGNALFIDGSGEQINLVRVPDFSSAIEIRLISLRFQPH